MKKLTRSLALCLAALMMTTALTACGSKEQAAPEAESSAQSGSAAPQSQEEKFIRFDSETIGGEAIDVSVFEENELTLVNLWATWCGPCVKEIPDLQKIAAADNGIGVIGMVADTYDQETGGHNQEAIDLALTIVQETGAEYPMIIPDATFMEENLKNAAALFPMSFLVDSEGKVVKGPIGGARSEQDWLDLIAEAAAQ